MGGTAERAMAIAVDDLSKAFGPVRVFDHLNLGIRSGEFFALTGANGAGKTTLIKSLVDLIRPDGGAIELLGRPSTRVEAREQVSYLPERFAAPRFLTGGAFLRYVLGLRRERYVESAAIEIARRLELDAGALRRRVSGYSKGMTQKLGLIAAFLSDADLLVLDEPMSGLDPQARYLVKRELRSLRECGTTVFYSTHLLADAEDLCDRIGVMHQGELRFVGSPEACCRRYGSGTLEEAYMRCIGAVPPDGRSAA
jgi:ABC-2 type transport system ATP-binding protein